MKKLPVYISIIALLLLCFMPGNVVYGQAVYDSAKIEEAPAIAIDSLSLDEEEEEKDIIFTLPQAEYDSVQLKHLPSGYIDSLKNNEAFDYVKTGIPRPEVKQKQEKQHKPFRLNINIDSVIVYIAIAIFAALLIWYITTRVFIKKNKTSEVEFTQEKDLPEDIFSIPYKEAIQKAMQQKNYRLAIRLHYLQLLKTLADKKIITYRPDKTNFDYLMQVRPTDHYNDFFKATRNYEYSWYGLFDISEEQYLKMEQVFENFYKRVK